MSLPRIPIKNLSPKEEVESTYLVRHINVNEAKDGKKYLNIILADGTGDIEGRAWNNAEELAANHPKGSYVLAKGKVNLFQGKKQIILNKLSSVDEKEIDKEEFVRKSSLNPEKMFEKLQAIIAMLDDVYIKELLENITNDPEIKRRLLKWQAGKTIHHAYQSGLLEHILSCSQLAISLSSHYSCNKNYVVAGAILHDLCKIYELTDHANVEYTEEGKLVGHLVKSLEIIDRFSYRIKDFPYNLKLHLKHICLSHHGEYEYGSPKIPQTKEAMLLHLIDNMDSKIHAFNTIIENDTQVGHWSNYVRHLDRIVYKGELPFYSEKTSKEVQQPTKKKSKSAEPTTSLSNMLKDFKV